MGILDGRVVIVTGAARGIGREEALECARQGAAVVLADIDPSPTYDVADEIIAAGGRAVVAAGDVADSRFADQMVRSAVEEYGRLDALVNNAGIVQFGTLVAMTDEEWDEVLRVHLRGHFAPTRAVCQYWQAGQRAGRIVHTSSIAGLLSFGAAGYATAKAGIATFSSVVAAEMAEFGVTSNAIAPAADTRMTEQAWTDEERAERERAVANGEFDFFAAENVAPLVAFLCSEDAGHITGKVFGVQGDSIEIFQPHTSVAEVKAGGRRWDPSELSDRIGELFETSGIGPELADHRSLLRYRIR